MSLEVSTFLPPAEMSARNRNLWGVGKKVHTMAGCTLLLSSNFLILSGLPHLKKTGAISITSAFLLQTRITHDKNCASCPPCVRTSVVSE